MKLHEIAVHAVRTHNAVLAGKVAVTLRFKFGLNDNQVWEWVNAHETINRPAWESLMLDADAEESQG